ncbi:hypothetical protein GQ85_09025 [Rhodococcus rhodochrous]|nr:hypothetical protein GQ85_09025 [Rhodococcus rhodochrous]
MAELEAQLVAAETRIGQLTATARRKTDQVKYLAGLLAAERRSADTAIATQAVRTQAVRSDNARWPARWPICAGHGPWPPRTLT